MPVNPTVKRVVSLAMRTSQARAMPNPAPAAGPLTAATTGFSIWRICRMSGL